MPFSAGETIGPYRIVEQLGQGGMATVYKAYHAALDRYVALKVLHPAFGEDPNFEARFRREARLVAKLDHPNIVPIYDYSEHENRPFLVMKFIEGETLKARMARGPLASDELTKLIEAVGSALSYAHKMGILHRDIKPSNVLLAADGAIYLADFGLARIAAAGESTLSGDMIMGTPQYISPEQAMGKKDLDEGTDIYSFGVMLYEMTVGQVPFNADTPFSIIHDHIYTPLPIPRSINPHIPESVERVLLKALAKERADRYATIAEMVTAFKQAWTTSGIPMQGTTITLPPHPARDAASQPASSPKVDSPPLPSNAEAPPKKKRSRWAIIAGAILLFVCCLFVFSAARRDALFPNADELATRTAAAQAEATPVSSPQPDFLSPLSIAEAERAVEQNPADAFAHLRLALAYWDAHQPLRAYDSLKTAADLANQDPTFFVTAGAEFTRREAWVPAASMYQRAITFSGEAASTDLINSYHEAVYKAVASKELPLQLPFDAIAKVDEAMALIAQGRFALHQRDTAQAREFLEQARHLKPMLAEVLLLDAEIAIKEGRIPEARQLLEQLLANPDTPEWVRAMADSHLSQIP